MATNYFVVAIGVCAILSVLSPEVEPARAAAGVAKEVGKQLKKSPDLLLDLADQVSDAANQQKQQPANLPRTKAAGPVGAGASVQPPPKPIQTFKPPPFKPLPKKPSVTDLVPKDAFKKTKP